MKTTYKFIIALFAATLALASCTKDVIAEKEDVNPQDGLRTIAVSFGASTKTYLDDDGVTPIFEEGDEIAVSNYKEEEQVSVERNEKGDLYFTTTLQGELVAIYPSSKASFEAGKPGFIVPVEQTGLFKDANIALAKIGEDANYATFVNQTAVLKFYIGPEIGVQSIIISSNSQLATDDSKIVVEVAKLRESKVIDPQERICYVAVLPGVLQMTVESFTSTQKVENSEGYVKREFQNVNLTHNTLANVFIPYYIPVNVGTEAEPECQYWAYCNVGAFLPEEPGYYFSWGNTDGHWLNAESEEYQFTNEVYSDTPGGEITESRLTPESDAAYVAWGGKWRMPTKTESMILKERVSRDYRYERYGYCFGDLFLPAAGHIADFGGSMVQWNKETSSEFWTSDKYSDNQHAYYFYKSPDTDSDTNSRHEGIPIRPIYGDPAQEQVALEINKYKEGPTL